MSKIVLGTVSPSASPQYTYDASVERATFLFGSLITGFFGFMLGLAGLLSIKVTSPVSHMVSSAVRSVLQTLLGVVILGEVVTGRRAASISVITMGALYYTWIMSGNGSASAALPLSKGASGADAAVGDGLEGLDRKRRWYKSHGHTHSLATLLPLHAPRPIRANSLSSSSPDRLGSISEEEEYYERERMRESGSGSGEEEKVPFLLEDERERERMSGERSGEKI